MWQRVAGSPSIVGLPNPLLYVERTVSTLRPPVDGHWAAATSGML